MLSGEDPLRRCLRYVMVYTGGKYIDILPRMLRFVVPETIWKEHRASISNAEKRGRSGATWAGAWSWSVSCLAPPTTPTCNEKPPTAATTTEVFDFLVKNPLIATLIMFDTHISTLLKETTSRILRIPIIQLRLWRSKAGKNAEAEFWEQRRRAFYEVYGEQLRLPYSVFYNGAGLTTCCCKTANGLFHALQKLVKFQQHIIRLDGSEDPDPPKGPWSTLRRKLGCFFFAIKTDAIFRDKRVCIYVATK